MKSFLKVVVLGLMLSVLAACGRIETGHVGVRTSWNKQVQKDVVTPGAYLAVTDSVQEYVTNEVTMQLQNLQPQTLDKSYLKDLDLTYIYKVTSSDLPNLVTQFKNRTLVDQHGDYYPMGLYVDTIMRAAVVTAVSKFNAFDANDHRTDIEHDIVQIATAKFKEEGLDEVIKIKQVTVSHIEVDQRLQEAVLRKLNAQTDNATKDIEISTAKKEADRMEQLTKNANNTGYIALLNAQANMKIAEGIAAGRVNTIVVPQDFKGIVNAK